MESCLQMGFTMGIVFALFTVGLVFFILWIEERLQKKKEKRSLKRLIEYMEEESNGRIAKKSAASIQRGTPGLGQTLERSRRERPTSRYKPRRKLRRKD